MRICAGIVTFNPDISLLSKNIEAIIPQVEKVFLFDNGSNNFLEIKNSFLDKENIFLIANEENKGIAYALNQLCKKAYEEEFDYIVTLDQDSICDEKCVINLQSKIENDIGIVCPRIDFIYDDDFTISTKSEDGKEIEACITSGSLTLLNAWKAVNGFDEWMFIDHVDDDFCMRLRLGGYRIVRSNKAVLYQRAGEMKYRKLIFGKRLRLFGYSPFRVYYITRNTIYFIRKYWCKINKVKELTKFVYSTGRMFLFEKNRFKVLPSFVRGFCDGVRQTIIKDIS